MKTENVVEDSTTLTDDAVVSQPVTDVTNDSDEIPIDNSIKARNYKEQQQQKKTTSSVKTSSSKTSTAQAVETRTQIRKETLQRAKERRGELKTKVQEIISVMKEKVKNLAKKPSNSVKNGTTIRR